MSTFEQPPVLSGTAIEQIGQLSRYLFRLSEMLNVANNGVTEQSVKTAQAHTNTYAGSGSPQNTYNDLHALIINTANSVKAAEDRLQNELFSLYEAYSEGFGAFTENIRSTITDTARSVVREFDYDSVLETLQQEAAGFSAYRISTEGYIRQGFIDYDENNVPIIGIAIGQNLRSHTVVVDGAETQQIDSNQSCAFYTADRVSFRVNGREVAYVSNSRLYILDVEIEGAISFSGEWMVCRGHGGFGLKRIGGGS